MTETALDIITKALKRLGVISGIETPSADLAADGLDRLTALCETWSTESLTLWTVTVTTTPILASHQPYTLGPAPADVVLTYRPAWVERVSVILPGTPDTEFPLQPLDRDEWQLLRQKGLSSTQPTRFYYEADYPAGSLYLWPVFAGGSINGLTLYLPAPLTMPLLLTTVFAQPPGYSRALRDWLAIELAPEVGRQVDGGLIAAATDAKAQLQRTNFRPRTLQMPAGLGCSGGHGYDWRVDE